MGSPYFHIELGIVRHSKEEQGDREENYDQKVQGVREEVTEVV